MPKISIIGYPRVGADRQLKRWTEDYFKGKLTKEELMQSGARLREEQWAEIKSAGVDYMPTGDFSFYDLMLDTAVMLNIIPKKYRDLDRCELDTTFAMAKGYQGASGDVVALPMKKWFNTNYHYIAPEYDASAPIKLSSQKPFEHYKQAKAAGIDSAKPVIIGPFTFFKHLNISAAGCDECGVSDDIAGVYCEYLKGFYKLSPEYVQFDEPSLCADLDADDIVLFSKMYTRILKDKGSLKVLLQTYFGDIRDAYKLVMSMDFDAYGLDFVEGTKTLELLKKYGFKKGAKLFAGVVNGKNIWRNDYAKTVDIINAVSKYVPSNDIVLSGSCSFLHSPYTVQAENKLSQDIKAHLAFAKEKLAELSQLKQILSASDIKAHELYLQNIKLKAERLNRDVRSDKVKASVAALKDSDFTRLPPRAERSLTQRSRLNLPPLPTTTIGSFPQTAEVKRVRSQYKKGGISAAEYDTAIKAFIADAVKRQEKLDIDVLVHGEFERNDMVEYFGENLDGFIFTVNGWVQSYGTRCVKPPIIWSDISRKAPITVRYSVYAQSLTDRPMKGMLTGPVTILNWSFPREDISLREMCYQIGLAVREEVLDLQQNGIKIIQIDEAALREKLPLRRSEWKTEYLDWCIPAFRLTHSGASSDTQIHTHMCYSEFDDIIQDIDDMDADVISFEASRSSLSILSALKSGGFKTEVGPGVYDIHSPRVPSTDEIAAAIREFIKVLGVEKLWINPDCGLKTRGWEETIKSLKNMADAVKTVRAEL